MVVVLAHILIEVAGIDPLRDLVVHRSLDMPRHQSLTIAQILIFNLSRYIVLDLSAWPLSVLLCF
jgi:hypothetical protein